MANRNSVFNNAKYCVIRCNSLIIQYRERVNDNSDYEVIHVNNISLHRKIIISGEDVREQSHGDIEHTDA